QVLRLLVLAARAGAEAEHPSPRVGQREHDPRAEAVIELPVLARALCEARVVELPVGEPATARGQQHAVPGARRIADAKGPQHLLAQPALLEVVASPARLLRLPQVALVVARGAVEQLEQPRAPLPPLGLARVLCLAL